MSPTDVNDLAIGRVDGRIEVGAGIGEDLTAGKARRDTARGNGGRAKGESCERGKHVEGSGTHVDATLERNAMSMQLQEGW